MYLGDNGNASLQRAAWVIILEYKRNSAQGLEMVLPINRNARLSAIIGGYFQNNWHNQCFPELMQNNLLEWVFIVVNVFSNNLCPNLAPKTRHRLDKPH